MNPLNLNKFMTIEGIEGVGKSTALKFIENYFLQKKINFIVTREPGGTIVAEQIRQILLTPNHDESLNYESELLLMFAARAQHLSHLIIPALNSGKFVISDRFIDASYAYQGGGRNIPISKIAMLEDWILKGIRPGTTILLDAPPNVGLMRAKKRGAHDRIEMEKIEFFDKVRNGYLLRAKQDTKRFHIIDATQSIEQVHQSIQNILDKSLGI